jgi:hypothetical protein
VVGPVPAPGTGATAECIAGAMCRPRPRVRKCPAAEDMAGGRGDHPRERGPAAVQRRQRPCRHCRAAIVAPRRAPAHGGNERVGAPASGRARRGRPPARAHAPPTMAVTTPVPWQSGQAVAPSLPLPPQRRQTVSPVPGVPAGASSPGFMAGPESAGREPSAGPAGWSRVGIGVGRRRKPRRATGVPNSPARLRETRSGGP